MLGARSLHVGLGRRIRGRWPAQHHHLGAAAGHERDRAGQAHGVRHDHVQERGRLRPGGKQPGVCVRNALPRILPRERCQPLLDGPWLTLSWFRRTDAAQELKAKSFDFLPFPELEQAVRDDVDFIRGSKLIPSTVTLSGWIYEVETGRTRRVV